MFSLKCEKKGSVLGLKAGLGVKPACAILREKHHSKNYFVLSKMSDRKEGTTEQAMDLDRIRSGERQGHWKSSSRKEIFC